MKLLDRIFLNLLFILVFSQLGAQTIVRSDCFVTDFEDTSEYNNWVLNSGSKGKDAPNRWFFGAGGANSGQAGLFVSGDGGVTANYVASPVSVVSYRALTLEEGDYEISSEDMPGWLVATEGSMTIALDVTITEALKQEGVARELINRIQNLRKSSGFEVTDKIDVRIFADGQDGEDIAASLENFGGYVAAQTLALSVAAAPLSEAGDAAEVEWNDGTIRIEVVRR